MNMKNKKNMSPKEFASGSYLRSPINVPPLILGRVKGPEKSSLDVYLSPSDFRMFEPSTHF